MNILNTTLVIKIAVTSDVILFCKMIGGSLSYILIKMFNLKEKDKNKIKNNAFYKPFNIGDYITVNNYEGTVEDITFRTTRIRDIANDVIVIPNSQIAENNIVNYSRKDSRFYSLLLTFELSTPLDKVADFKEKLMLLLNLHEHVLNENIRVFFHTISDNGINVKITFYTDILNYADFLKFKEEMNFSILDLVQKTGIELAYDSKTIYLKK